MKPAPAPVSTPAPKPAARPPFWLIAATGILAATCLVLAIAETNLWAHYLIDGGEFVSLFGLAFILVAGLYLHRQHRLAASLPLVAPWLLYPVITQGDQIIDNLSINSMRAVCHVLLGAIFGTPVAVIVLSARYALAPQPGSRPTPGAWTAWFPGLRQLAEGRTQDGMAYLGVALLVAEMWVADQFLGTLMIVTLIIMVFGVLYYASASHRPDAQRSQMHSARAALVVLCVGVATSFGLYVGFKNRPGAYQGSPSAFLDPAQHDAGYPLDRIPVPSGTAQLPAAPDQVRGALTAYADTLETMLAGYHVLDRNYTYDFHNELFLRHTPLVPEYRRVGLSQVATARTMRTIADERASTVLAGLAPTDPLAALLTDVRAYVAYDFDRAPVLEDLSAGFEQTPAGLQHAAHLYEGENKMLGQRLADILAKHHAVIDDPRLASVTSDFATKARAIHEAYAHHVVGF